MDPHLQQEPAGISDDELVARYQTGNTEYFGQLYDRYLRPLYAYLYLRTRHRETAEDLTSLTFTKALEALSKFKLGKGTVQSWLYTIARRTLIDHYRTNRPMTDLVEADGAAARDDAARLDAKMVLEKVGSALAQLTELQREIVVLRVINGLSYREIASLIGSTEAACKMSFSRGTAQLRQYLPLIILAIIQTHV